MASPRLLEVPGDMQWLAFSTDGAHLAAVAGDQPISRNVALAWEVATGQEVLRLDLGPEACAQFVPATKELALLSRRELILWSLGEGRQIATKTLWQPQVSLIALPDGRLGSVSVDRPYYDDDERPPEPDTIRIIRVEDGEGVIEATGTDKFQLAFVPTLNLLAIANFEHLHTTTLGLWDLAGQECVAGLDGSDADASECCWFSPDGRRIAWISNERGMIRLLEIDEVERRWRTKWEIPRPSAWAASIDLGARGGSVAAWASEVEEETNKVLSTHVIAIDGATGQERWRRAIEGKCYDVALSPDESLVAAIVARVGNWYKDPDAFTLMVMDAATGAEVMTETSPARKSSQLIQHRRRLNFSPDGAWIAVNHTRHVELWQVMKKEEVVKVEEVARVEEGHEGHEGQEGQEGHEGQEGQEGGEGPGAA